MEQICIYMTQKQIDYVRTYSKLNKTNFNEGLRRIIDKVQKMEREDEIKRAKVIK